MKTIHVQPTTLEFRLAERLAILLDDQFRIGNWGFGLDAIVDLLPVGGDVVVLALSLYLVFVAFRMELPREEIARMLFNIVLAFLVGLIPVIGDVAYLAFKPNMRNLEILRKHVYTGTVQA
jgi:hypothetical protein